MNRWKAGKLWFLELLLLVFVAGCGLKQKFPAPSLKSISPRSASPGETVVITLLGTGFQYGSTVNVGGAAKEHNRSPSYSAIHATEDGAVARGALMTVSDVHTVNTTTITARFAITANAVPGPVNISVSTYGLNLHKNTYAVTTNAVTFTIRRSSPPF